MLPRGEDATGVEQPNGAVDCRWTQVHVPLCRRQVLVPHAIDREICATGDVILLTVILLMLDAAAGDVRAQRLRNPSAARARPTPVLTKDTRQNTLALVSSDTEQ